MKIVRFENLNLGIIKKTDHVMSPQQDFLPYEGRPHTRYLLCSTARSGSTLVSDLLAGTGLAGDPQEYLNRRIMAAWMRRQGIQDGLMNLDDYLAFLDAHRTTPNGIFGIKVHFEHLQDIWGKDVRAMIEFIKGFDRVVLLSRQDKLAQAVSLHKARVTQIWTSEDVRFLDEEDPRLKIKPGYNPASIAKALAQTIEHESYWRALLKKAGMQYTEIVYETFVKDRTRQARDLFNLLGLDKETPIKAPGIQRQGSQDDPLLSAFRKEIGVTVETGQPAPGPRQGAHPVPAATPAGKPQRKPHAYAYKVAACTIFRDEAKFLNEWLTFHQGVGIQHFYLYNNKSEDHYQEVLAPWIEQGVVTLTDWPEKSQVEAFNHCLGAHRSKAEWIAFIDMDEFVFSPADKNLYDVLQDYDEAAAVFIYWALYGSSGHKTAPKASVLESYTKRQALQSAIHDAFDHGTPGTPGHVTGWSRDGKSIVRTSAVEVMNNHMPSRVRWGLTVDENHTPMPASPHVRRKSKEPFSHSILRINHYWSKCIDDLTRRSRRGSAYDPTRPHKDLSRVLAREQGLNEIEDQTILPIWERIKGSKP
jgi:trehalose 2-sulfotransferase